MAPNSLFYPLLLAALVLVCLIIHVWWPDPLRAVPPLPVKPDQPRHKRSKEPKPFTGYIQKPLCKACEHGLDSRPQAPGSPPPVLIFNRGRKRTVDTAGHFCPAPDCSYHGWLGRGVISAPMALPAANPGASFNVCRARDISTRPTARCSTANAPHPS